MKDSILKIIASNGGISRLTIFNDDWHKKKENKESVRLLFGHRRWEETKTHVREACFPGEVCVDDPRNRNDFEKGVFKLPPLSAFERCLLCRMFFHVFPNQQIVILIIGRDCT